LLVCCFFYRVLRCDGSACATEGVGAEAAQVNGVDERAERRGRELHERRQPNLEELAVQAALERLVRISGGDIIFSSSSGSSGGAAGGSTLLLREGGHSHAEDCMLAARIAAGFPAADNAGASLGGERIGA
jgi:hypothetical protein